MIKKLGSAIIHLVIYNLNFFFICKQELPCKDIFQGYNLQMICVFCKNREEWLLLDIAAVHYGF